jgi:hypothetical protein
MKNDKQETDIWRAEYPECATKRHLNVHGLMVTFPSHPKRKTKAPHHDGRWIKHSSLWELSQKSMEWRAFQELGAYEQW